MKNTSTIYIVSFLLALSTIFTTGCESLKNTNKTQRGAGIGAVGGAVLGAVVGKYTGNTAAGAVIGGAVGGVTGGIIGKKMDKQAREIGTSIPGAEVERVGEGIKLVLGETAVRFNISKSTLTPEAQANLDKLSEVFQHYPDTDVMIYGYTDSSGKLEYNQKLSEERAASVKTYLASKGLVESRFQTKGMGIEDPIADNETKEGRSKNRRVEFAIVANEKMKEDAQHESEESAK